jgi:hypothetical protein
MNEVYSNQQAAELLGVSKDSLRVIKSRNKEQLIEGTHWFLQDNQTLWTVEGLEALKLIQNTVKVRVSEVETSEDAVTDTPVTEGVTSVSTDPLQRYSGLINAVADAITPGLLQRIDNAVTGRVKSAIATPMTSTECVTLLNELGLKPCNPELLLSGNQPNLLTESKEN